MNSTKLFFHIRHLSLTTSKYCVNWNSFQQHCLLHTSLPLMNTEKSIDQKDSIKSNENDELPHMRVKTYASAEEKDLNNYMMHHEIYSTDELKAVKVTHKKIESWHDRIAYAAVRTLRFFFDTFTGYVHESPKSKTNNEKQNHRPKKIMTEKEWLRRVIFLESIAGVPGMVAGMNRHMKSLRTMRRDHGWIHTLLSEAENERMHLLTFLELRQPGWIFRAFVLLGQGVFFNGFFLTYLLSPKICHRFVGFLEEEAVITYTRCIEELDAGRLPIWSKTPAPQVAKNYWKLSDNAMMRDVLLAIRADEATHRQVNHKLADVGSNAPNPFLSRTKGEREPFDETEQKEIDTAGKK
ncbi:unnamed protein product [Rotaria sordida]|uniref:Alternative oxidase n=1 Tax=Rotaria sordida TaxID=392033 RepID=A0A814W102_9BILA|nr:unnamed protein product [Rotaria sordida]CAF3829811.1 unnamed protein product [Rotaria sordida]